MMSSVTHLPEADAWGITCLCVLNCVLILISTKERMWVTKPDVSKRSIGSLMWQHKRIFHYLWMARAVLGVISCTLPLPAMWVELVIEKNTEVLGHAVVWAASGLVACICGSIVAERLLYVGFSDSLSREQFLCILASIFSVFLLITAELTTTVPNPGVWSVAGCALHRFSMLAWWLHTTHKTNGSMQFRQRARLTLCGHGIAFACVFLTFLPIFDSRLNRLFWLFACSFSVELVTTFLSVRATFAWCTEQKHFSLSTSSPPSYRPSVSSSREQDKDVPMVELREHRTSDTVTQYARAETSYDIPMTTVTIPNREGALRSPPAAHLSEHKTRRHKGQYE